MLSRCKKSAEVGKEFLKKKDGKLYLFPFKTVLWEISLEFTVGDNLKKNLSVYQRKNLLLIYRTHSLYQVFVMYFVIHKVVKFWAGHFFSRLKES